MNRTDPIPLLYDAAIGEADWITALDCVSERLGGTALFLGIGDPYDPASLEVWAVNHDLVPTIGREVIWNPQVNLAVRVGLTMPVGRAMSWRAFIPEEEFLRNDFMQTTIVKRGFVRCRIFVPLRERDLLAGGYIARLDGDEIEGAAADTLDRIVPHIGRALRLRNEIGRHRDIAASLHSALESLSVGVVVVNAQLRILFANQLAEAILEASDGITAVRGRLALTTPVRDGVLRAVQGAGRRDGVPPGSAISAPRPSGRTAYTLRVFPAIGTGQLRGAVSACATITIHDPAAQAALPEAAQLRDAFGLTPAEAAVARLVPLAESKRVMADRLGVSENTVKTHLTSIRAKLGAHNVAKLTRIIAHVAVAQSPGAEARVANGAND